MISSGEVHRFALLLVSTMHLASCQTPGSAGMITSSVSTELTQEEANSIARDLVGKLAEQVGPGRTTIQLRSEGAVFKHALETSLRKEGYAVATDRNTEVGVAVPLAYVIDRFEGRILVRLSTPFLDLTRMYEPAATGALPTSPISVIKRGTGTP